MKGTKECVEGLRVIRKVKRMTEGVDYTDKI